MTPASLLFGSNGIEKTKLHSRLCGISLDQVSRTWTFFNSDIDLCCPGFPAAFFCSDRDSSAEHRVLTKASGNQG
jgi:hypothetical protein